MKNKTTLLLVCLLIALAQGADVINWGGNWDLKTPGSNIACYPARTVLITQAVGTVTASWIWDNSQPCIDAKVANKQFTQTVPTPKNNAIDFTDVTFRIDASDNDFAYFTSKNGASSIYSRRKIFVDWLGTYDMVSKNDKLCNPDGSITIHDSGAIEWTWAKTQACVDAGNAGETFKGHFEAPSGNVIDLQITEKQVVIPGIFAVIRDQAVLTNARDGTTNTFIRRQQLVNWIGTWDIEKRDNSPACYPDGYVTIIPNGANLDASWVWENSKECAGLAGQPFTHSQPVPRGRGLFLDFFIGGVYISGVVTVNEFVDATVLTFVSKSGAYANFMRRNQMVSWAGVFDIATKDSTVCSPDGSITVVQNALKTTDKLSISWTWAKTDACKSLALSGEVKRVVDTPTTENSISLDVSSSTTTVKGLLTLFLDGAVFSSTNGASTYTRRQENVAFVGDWQIQHEASETACYPHEFIYITQSGGSVTAQWIWALSDPCKQAGLAGNRFEQTTPRPQGRALFLDIVIPSTKAITRISGLFSVSGDKGTFDSSNGASAVLTRVPEEPKVPEKPSEGGSWGTIIIVLLIIVAIGVAGYLYVQNRNKKLLSADLNASFSESYTRT